MQAIDLDGRDGPAKMTYLVPFLCALVQVLDGYDLSTIGLAVPSLVKEWGLRPAEFTQAFALSSIGIMVGAMVAGPCADRFGRRPMLLFSVIVFAVFSLASTWATSLPMLVALRFLTGVGIGGAMPTTIALTADYVPQKWRATAIMFMFCGNTLGGFIAGQVASATIPVWGWHAIFFIGGVVPLALFPVLYFLLPESMHFGKVAASNVVQRNPVAGLFRPGLVSTTVLLWVIFLLNLLNMYLISYWLPTVLTLEGITPADAAFAASIYSAGGVLSTIVLGLLLARLRAEHVLATNVAVGIACILLMVLGGLRGPALYAVLFGAGWGFVGSQLGLNGFAASVYPKELRSTGAGWALGIGRLGGILGPILGGTLIALGLSPTSIMLFVCGPGVITVITIVAIGILRNGRTASADLAADARTAAPV